MTSPERFLWLSVIQTAMEDLEEFCQKKLTREIRVLQHEIEHEYFGLVCEWAEIDQSHILKLAGKIRRKYGL